MLWMLQMAVAAADEGPVKAAVEEARRLEDAGKCAEAIPVYQQYVADPTVGREARRGLGACLIGTGKPEEGIGELEALYREKESAWSANWLGWGYRELGYPRLSARAYLKGIQLDSENAWAHRSGLDVLVVAGETRQASEIAEKAVALNPERCWVRQFAAEALFSVGAADRANVALQGCFSESGSIPLVLAFAESGFPPDGSWLLTTAAGVDTLSDEALAGVTAAMLTAGLPYANLLATVVEACEERASVPLECRLARFWLGELETLAIDPKFARVAGGVHADAAGPVLELMGASRVAGEPVADTIGRGLAQGAASLLVTPKDRRGLHFGTLPNAMFSDERVEPEPPLTETERNDNRIALVIAHLGLVIGPSPLVAGDLHWQIAQAARNLHWEIPALVHYGRAWTRFQEARHDPESSRFTAAFLHQVAFAGGDWRAGWGTYRSAIPEGKQMPVARLLEQNMQLASRARIDTPAGALLGYAHAEILGEAERRAKAAELGAMGPRALETLLRWHARRLLNLRTVHKDDALGLGHYGTQDLLDLARRLANDIDALEGGTEQTGRVDAYLRTFDFAWLRLFADGGALDGP